PMSVLPRILDIPKVRWRREGKQLVWTLGAGIGGWRLGKPRFCPAEGIRDLLVARRPGWPATRETRIMRKSRTGTLNRADPPAFSASGTPWPGAQPLHQFAGVR